MPLRMAITKATASGEQFVVDVCQWNPVTGDVLHSVNEMTQMADDALRLGDLRMMEMNQRMLEAYNLEKYFSPQIWSRVVAILDILAGRQSADTVARRWQSEIEETAELEVGRLAAMQKRCCICSSPIDIMDYSTSTNSGEYLCHNCVNTVAVNNND